jgi:hypothetical protein
MGNRRCTAMPLQTMLAEVYEPSLAAPRLYLKPVTVS